MGHGRLGQAGHPRIRPWPAQTNIRPGLEEQLELGILQAPAGAFLGLGQPVAQLFQLFAHMAFHEHRVHQPFVQHRRAHAGHQLLEDQFVQQPGLGRDEPGPQSGAMDLEKLPT